MKKTFMFIITAAFAAAALASCTKESAGVDKTEADGVRVITISFAQDTKATLDGYQPKFSDGDLLTISNGSEVDSDCQVSVDSKGKATITTTLDGDLTAVYPGSAAVLEDNKITGIKVEASQNGAVADAIAAMATIEAGAKQAVFHNQTALFKITPPEGVTKFTITSLKSIGEEGAWRGQPPVAINSEDSKNDNSVITVDGGSSPLGTYYVSLLPGVCLSDLSFDAGETYGMKGIPAKSIENDATVAGAMYTITDSGWHPYVTIKGRKWATMNIGAESPEDNGLYFAWGDTKGQKLSQGAFSTPFNWANAPFNGGDDTWNPTKINKDYDCPSLCLPLWNDAAYVNWGGAWRMPTADEFARDFLDGPCPEGLTFPVPGYGKNNELKGEGVQGFYWSSWLDDLLKDAASMIVTKDGSIIFFQTGLFDRFYGASIRPVAD